MFYSILSICFYKIYYLGGEDVGMLSFFISILSGIATGIGIGGGTILIIGLTLFLGIEQKVAQSINLIFFIPTAITSSIINTRRKKIRWRVAIIVIISSIIGAIIGVNITMMLEIKTLRKLFGVFIGCIAIYEIYSLLKQYIINKKRNNNKR